MVWPFCPPGTRWNRVVRAALAGLSGHHFLSQGGATRAYHKAKTFNNAGESSTPELLLHQTALEINQTASVHVLQSILRPQKTAKPSQAHQLFLTCRVAATRGVVDMVKASDQAPRYIDFVTGQHQTGSDQWSPPPRHQVSGHRSLCGLQYAAVYSKAYDSRPVGCTIYQKYMYNNICISAYTRHK